MQDKTPKDNPAKLETKSSCVAELDVESGVLGKRFEEIEARIDGVQSGYERMTRILNERLDLLQNEIQEDRLFIAHELMDFKIELYRPKGLRGLIYRMKERRRPEDRESKEVKK